MQASHTDSIAETFEDPLVEVHGLKKYFPVYGGLVKRKTDEVRAVDDVSFAIPKGKTCGLVGESGSGKTTLGKSITRIIEPTAGEITIDGERVDTLRGKELKNLRKNVQMVFQDPSSSLNPRHRIVDIISDPLKVHTSLSEKERIERVDELLDIVGIPEDYKYSYPHALSGGQKQRVGIARAMILQPDFLVLDEPTSALDVSVQARTLDLFERLQDQFDLTYLFITHDISVAKQFVDYISVMYLGKIVEFGPVEAIFERPSHPYTRALLSAVPVIFEDDRKYKPDRIQLQGEIPDPREKPTGCGFRTRCPEEFKHCKVEEPPMYRVGDHHFARCFLYDDSFQEDTSHWD